MSFPVHPWKVVERGWQPNTQRFAESLMSLANGYMGLRGNFEEDYSGDSFQGTYLGGVWYPDKTRVGWWKKGYPEYYAKVINTINLIGIHVIIDQHPLDLSRATVWEYEREVDMRTAVLYRHACVDMDKGSLTLDTWRFVSMDTKELLAIRYQVTPSFDCRMEVSPYLDGNVRNLDANYDQSFWNMVDGEGWDERGGVLVQTKPNPYGVQRFTVAAAMTNRVEGIDYIDMASKAGYCAALYAGDIHSGTTVSVEKYVAVFTSRDHDKDQLMDLAMAAAQQACDDGWQKALKAHQAAWHERWEMADVQIEGDDSAQQGIHFNLFQLLSTYTGSDARLNIGPKGLYGRTLRRIDVLGYGSLLPAGVSGDSRGGHGAPAAALPLSPSRSGETQRGEPRYARRTLSRFDHQRQRVSQRVGSRVRGHPPQCRDCPRYL